MVHGGFLSCSQELFLNNYYNNRSLERIYKTTRQFSSADVASVFV